jgi:hypothetical protein
MESKYQVLAAALSRARVAIQCGAEINRVQVYLRSATVNGEYELDFCDLNTVASTRDTGLYLDELRKLQHLAMLKALGGE